MFLMTEVHKHQVGRCSIQYGADTQHRLFGRTSNVAMSGCEAQIFCAACFQWTKLTPNRIVRIRADPGADADGSADRLQVGRVNGPKTRFRLTGMVHHPVRICPPAVIRTSQVSSVCDHRKGGCMKYCRCMTASDCLHLPCQIQ